MSDLSAIWTKSNCLSRTQLLHYLQHTLEREEEYLVESHLNGCSLCSDALEGLMHADLNRVTVELDEIRKAFEAAVATAVEKEKPKVPAPALKPRRTYWLYAASVLLIIGLGYSVFSFIQGEQGKRKTLGQETGAKISDANKPNFAVNDSSMERMRLKLSQEELYLADAQEKAFLTRKHNKEAFVAQRPTIDAEEMLRQEFDVPPVRVQEELQEDKEFARASEADERIALAESPKATEASNDLIQTQEGTSSGRPGQGMKKSAPPINQSPATNQLNYSSTPENRNIREDVEKVQTVSSKNKTERVEVQDAIKLYTKGNYRRSIRELLRLLPSSRGTEKEDILYYLGMAYLEEGEEAKAEMYLAQLQQSERYKTKASELMKGIQKQ